MAFTNWPNGQKSRRQSATHSYLASNDEVKSDCIRSSLQIKLNKWSRWPMKHSTHVLNKCIATHHCQHLLEPSLAVNELVWKRLSSMVFLYCLSLFLLQLPFPLPLLRCVATFRGTRKQPTKAKTFCLTALKLRIFLEDQSDAWHHTDDTSVLKLTHFIRRSFQCLLISEPSWPAAISSSQFKTDS